MDGYITIGTKVDTKSFDSQILDLERKANDLEKMLESPKDIGLSEKDIQEIEVELEKTKNKLVDLYKQRMKLQNVNKKDKSFEGINLSLDKSIKKAGKLALAIGGVSSAYMLLKRASSDLASYDEQYASNLEYIRFALTQAIAPALQNIVNLAGQLLGYLNAIAQTWFSINLFGNASVDDFNNMKRKASGVAGAVKEIKKQLAGFDELNVLSDNTSSGGGGGGGVSPSFDLTQFQGETPEWLKWIIDHKDEILAVLSGIATAVKLISWGLGIVKGLGIGVAIAGIVYAISGLIDYLQNPVFENFGKIFEGIGIAIIGVAIAIGNLPVALVGAIVVIWGLIVKYWEQIKSYFQGNLDWFADQSDWVRNTFGDLVGNIYDSVIMYAQMVLNILDDILQGVKRNFDEVISFFKNVFTGNWEEAWKNILNIATSPIEFLRDLFTRVLTFFRDIIDNFINFLSGKRDWVQANFGDTITNLYDMFIKNLTIARNFINDLMNALRTHFDNIIGFIKNVFTGNWEGAWQNIGNIVTNVFDFIGKTIGNILNGIWNVITGWATAIGTAVGDAISGAFKNVVNGILGAVEYILNGPIRTINSLIGVINAIPGVDLGYLSTFSLPRLAVGGIVNMPNTGTLIGGAIAGESGREGVLPLTDSQTMSELGREIGRWITINANITNTMNGRVISRELRQIQNEQSFAYNT